MSTDNSIIVEIVGNFTLALPALPVILLGMWLSTKNWSFYSIVVMGIAWIVFVVSGMVYNLCTTPEVATCVKIIAWTIPSVFFIVLNIGSIFTVQSMRRG